MADYVLGFSGIAGTNSVAHVHNPAAVLLKDGRFIAGAGEERFNRIKNSPGIFPHHAIRWVLETEGIGLNDVSAIAWSNNPVGGLQRWQDRTDRRAVRRLVGRLVAAADGARRTSSLLRSALHPRFSPAELVTHQRAQFVHHFGSEALDIPFECVDHHHSHAASAYFPSGMSEATVVTWDGSGDGLSCSIRHGLDGRMRTLAEFGDFSIGELYAAIHSYLKLSDEGSLMGLAAYGSGNGSLDGYVRPRDLWMDLKRLRAYGQPFDKHFGYSMSDLTSLAPWIPDGAELASEHRDLAAELQDKVEQFCFEIIRRAVAMTGCKQIALAGGVALNAVFNGKLGRTPDLCETLFVQPNAGDEGGALGAACVVAGGRGADVSEPMQHAYFGPDISSASVESTFRATGVPYSFLDDNQLVKFVAGELAQNKIVGWVQGRMEWGPRALGNRSILADPRSRDAGTRVNAAVKYRDPWRPFAPSMLADAADAYLIDPFFSPFMVTTFMVRPERRSEIPSVVHADGSTRPQMVTREGNPRFYNLIEEFGAQTGTPILLNTSFNLKGEPIVRSPLDAIRTFFGSGLDVLVIGNFIVTKEHQGRDDS